MSDIDNYDGDMPDGNEVAGQMMARVNAELADRARQEAVRDNPDLAPFADLLQAPDAESMKALTDDLAKRLRSVVTTHTPPAEPIDRAVETAREGLPSKGFQQWMKDKGVGIRGGR